MTFVEAVYLVLGVVLGIVGIALVRWLLLRQTQHALAGNLIEELNAFNTQIRKLADRMRELSVNLDRNTKGRLASDDPDVAETMSEMNRLLHEINDFFAREEAEWVAGQVTDFTSTEEQNKFEEMESISDDELKRADWDDLIDKLRDEEK